MPLCGNYELVAKQKQNVNEAGGAGALFSHLYPFFVFVELK